MKRIVYLTIIISTLLVACEPEEQITVAAYYFPNYHEDQRNASYFEGGWTYIPIPLDQSKNFFILESLVRKGLMRSVILSLRNILKGQITGR